MNIYAVLFFEFFKIALFTIGGGLAMIPVIENVLVKKKKLLESSDIVDMVAMTQLVPGLIAINSAVFVGHKLAGWKGSVIAMLGAVLPSILIILVIAMFFPLLDLQNTYLIKAFSCIKACVTGIFFVLAFKIGKSVLKSGFSISVVLCLLALLVWGMNSVYIILLSCLIGILSSYIGVYRIRRCRND